MKTLSLFLALVNILLSGLILAFSLSPTELIQAKTWWSLTKVAAASSVIFIGVLTWFGTTHIIRTGLVALCSLFLVALGAATVVWTFHLALVSSDIEFFMIVYGGSLAVQGVASLLGFANDTHHAAS